MTTPAAKIKAETENNNEEDTSIKFNLAARVPTEIWQNIFLYLLPEDLRSARDCCLRWKAMLGSDFLWRELCLRDGYSEVEVSKRSECYNNFVNRHDYYWEGVYWYNYTLQRNWETNNYRQDTYEITDEDCCFRSFVWYVFDDVFCRETESPDKKLYVYNFRNKEEVRTFVFSIRNGNNDSHGVISKEGNYLIRFVKRTCLTVWDFVNGSTVLDMLCQYVTGIHVYKNLIVLQMCNKKFQVYNIETRQIEYESKDITMNVSIMDGTILFTTMDHVIHILKWDDRSLIKCKCCGETDKNILLVKNDILISLCTKAYIKQVTLCVWNITTKAKLHSIPLEYSAHDISNAFFMNKYLYLNIDDDFYVDGTFVQLWDFMKGTLEFKVDSGITRDLNSHSKVSNDDFIVVIRPSSTLALWSLRKRDYLYDLDFGSNSDHADMYSNVLIDNTKLMFIEDKSQLLLHVRDFEPL